MPKKSDNSGSPKKSPAAKPKIVKPRVAAPKTENPDRSGFNPGTMDSSIIALPLLRQIQEEGSGTKDAKGAKDLKGIKGAESAAAPAGSHDVIIDVNLDFPGGRQEARKQVRN